ncbi:hypothetical protein RJ639_028467 [Escallonia herrerae]|uniref:C2H2-type domain-containing protein n=1 Tax=Escallonia herrerae TaxID=1293975 RepID=A0AA89BLK5_9ASTE|nr:hypothetical protein RJ639_028467 [Escallonia herrerae]
MEVLDQQRELEGMDAVRKAVEIAHRDKEALLVNNIDSCEAVAVLALVAGSSCHVASEWSKRQRKAYKRQRPSPPFGVAMTSSSSYDGDSGGDSGSGAEGVGAYFSLPSPTTSDENYAGMDQDKDMANCLILLPQSGCQEKIIVKSYECRTCNQSFPSFQALGGHRESHKKPKGMEEERNCNVQNHSPMLAPCSKKVVYDATKIAEEKVQGK